jgi:DNA-binding transcriptional LysR family regulator
MRYHAFAPRYSSPRSYATRAALAGRCIYEAVRAGLGVALIPEFLVREDVRSRRLVRLLPQWEPKALPVHVVYDGHRMLPARVRAFIDFALSFLAKELGRFRGQS